MTIQQAYYRMVFKEHGVTDYAFQRCASAANLIVSLRVDELIQSMQPAKPFSSEWGYMNDVYSKALNPRLHDAYPYTLMM